MRNAAAPPNRNFASGIRLGSAFKTREQKYRACIFPKISNHRDIPPRQEGRSRTSRTRGGMRWTWMCLTDERRKRGRRSRVVPTPRRWRQVSRIFQRCARGDGGKQALAHQGEHGVSRKTNRAGKAGVFFAYTCGLRAFCATFSREGPRVRGEHPACALSIEGGQASWQSSGETRREDASVCALLFDNQICCCGR